MRIPACYLLVTLALVAPSRASAQPLDNVMSAIRNGGGWVSVPIVQGRGSASTATIPTMGLTLTGCVRVWDGHSGTWQIRARENINAGSLSANLLPGRGAPFSHTFGVRSQLEVDFVWSEQRDTTLFLWVGVKGADDPRDACVPKS